MSVDIAQAAINPTTGRPLRVADDQARSGNITMARKLLADLAEFDAAFGAAKRDEWNLAREEARYTKAYAVEQNQVVIDLLKELRRAARSTKGQESHTVPTGRYAVDNAEGQTAFYRVVVGDNGFTKVQVYSSDALIDLAWPQGLAVLRKIEAFGIHEAEVRFGTESQRCYKCNRRLTQAHTRAAGIGDDCKSRLG